MSAKRIIPLVAISCLACDQLSKWWARAELPQGEARALIPAVIQLNLTTNTGGAFGIGRELSWLMTGLAIVLTAAIVLWIVKREEAQPPPRIIERLGLGFLLGGALGNLCDRLTVGRVTDFLEFAFVSFPVFNVADMSIDTGIFLIAIAYYRGRKAPEREGGGGTTQANGNRLDGRSAPEKQ